MQDQHKLITGYRDLTAEEIGLIVAEIIQFADQRNASTSTSEEEFGLAELLAAAYEAVAGKRVA